MSYSTTVLADSPLAYWRLGESPGATSLVDAAGNGADLGNLVGSYTLGAAGALSGDGDTAVSFSGLGAYFNGVTTAISDPLTGDFAVEFWIKTTSATRQDTVSYVGLSEFGVESDGKAFFQLYTEGSPTKSTASVSGGSWHHVVITRDSGVMKIYVDGSLDSSHGSNGHYCFFSGGATSEPILAAATSTRAAPVLGTLDEVALYGAALSSSRVAAHYAAGTAGGSSATAFTLSGPSSGTVGVASGNFTFTPTGGNYTGTITPTTSGTGIFTPTSLSWSGTATAQTCTYTPGSTAGSPHHVNGSSAPSLAQPSDVTYTVSSSPASSYTLSGPPSGPVNLASTNFTVTPVGGVYTGTITPHTTGSGTFAPTSLSWSGTGLAQTFTYTPTTTSGSPHSISTTASPTLGSNPSPVSYAVTSGPVAYTSVASGNWNSPSTWVPAGVPTAANGDTATISSGHTVTVPQGYAASVGDGTASTVLTATVGQLTVAGGTLVIRGNALFGAYTGGGATNTLTVQSTSGHPAGIELDGNSGVTPVVSFDDDTAVFLTGTASDRCFARTATGGVKLAASGGAGNPGRFTLGGADNGSYRSLRTTAAYCDFSYLGDASHVGWGPSNLNASGNTLSLDHCTIDHCGPTPGVVCSDAGAVVSITHCTWTNVVNPPNALDLGATVAPSGGVSRLLDHCDFDGFAGYCTFNYYTITSCWFDDIFNVVGAQPGWTKFDGNVVRKQGAHILGFNGDCTNNLLLWTPTAPTETGYALWGPNGDSAISDNVFQYSGPDLDGVASWSMGYSHSFPAITHTQTVTGNLILPCPNAVGPAGFFPISDVNDAPVAYYVYEHNTVCTSGNAAFTDGAGLSSKANAVQSLRSNLCVNAGTTAYLFDWRTDTPPAYDVVQITGGAAQADYNGWLGLKTVPPATYSSPRDQGNGTVYSVGISAVPGTHDVGNTDPLFADPTRDVVSWAQTKDGSITDLAGALAYLRSHIDLVKTDLIPWVRAGFRPTNSAVLTAAHDGTTIGAVQAATATGYTLTAPAPAKGDVATASGDFTVTPDAAYTGTITITPSGGGLSTPVVLTFSGSAIPQTFTITPKLLGTVTLTPTNSGGLVNPSAVTYLGMVQLGSSGTGSSGNNCPSFGGQDLFANGAWLPEFKRDVTGDAVDPSSSALVALYGSDFLHRDFSATGGGGEFGQYGIPVNVVPGTQATKAITYTVYPAANPPDAAHPSDPGPAPLTNTLSVENQATFPTSDPSPSDGHGLVAVRNETTGLIDTLWEFQDLWSEDGGTSFKAHGGAKFNIATGAQRPDDITSAEAAGMTILPLLLRYDEVKLVLDGLKADLGHAIRIAVPFVWGKYVWPARVTVGGSGTPNQAMGGRLRLKSSWYAANRSTYSGQAGVIIDAIRKYGLICADISGTGYGSGPYVCGVSDDRWDTSTTTGVGCVGTVPVSALELITYAPGWTHTGPTSGNAGQAYTFTVARNPAGAANFNANIYLTLDGSTPGAEYSTTQITLSDGSPSGTYTFTPPTAGTYTLDGAPGGQEWYPPDPITFTAAAGQYVMLSGGGRFAVLAK